MHLYTASRRFFQCSLLLLALLLPVAAVAQVHSYDWSIEAVETLYPGIERAYVETSVPRNLKINCLRIDTTEANIQFYTTPRAEDWELDAVETMRQSTRDFLRACRAEGMRMGVAVNADAFSPWPAPWDESTPADLLGLAISDGTLVSAPNDTPSLLVYEDGRLEMRITNAETNLEDVETAVSGFSFALEDGSVVSSGDDLHPRTGLGLSEDGETLYIMTIDGRRHATRGATVHEVGALLHHFGAQDGINMDGGGSTTLAWWDESLEAADKAVLLNEPIATGSWLNRTPEAEDEGYEPTERYVGNNLGIIVEASEE